MFLLSYFIILCATITITNKQNEVNASDEVLEFTRNDSLIIVLVGLVVFILELIVPNFLSDFYLPILVITSLAEAMIFVIVNKNRDMQIKKQHEQINKVYEALGKLIIKPKDGIDYNNIPFVTEEENGNINLIKIDMQDPDRFNDNYIMQAVYSLNKFFPEFQWVPSVDFPQRTCVFEGQQLPPSIAMFPGTDLRPSGWIPLGLGGSGEVGWNLSNPKDKGESLYTYEDGTRAGIINMPSAPQALCLGSTGGGKSIVLTQTVQIIK